MRIDYTKYFLRKLKKAPFDVQKAFQNRVALFISNQHHPLLRNHKLTGVYNGCRSINITGDWRAVYREVDLLIEEPLIYFQTLGTHSQLYK